MLSMSSVHWSERHVLHKLGVIGVVLATLLFLVGFSVPAWTVRSGLWMRCSSDVCTTNFFSHSDVWMNVVRVMECLALLALVVCVLVEVVQDFYLYVPPSPRNKAVEILALIAGILGIAGTTIFGIKSVNDVTFNTPTSDPVLHQHEDHSYDLQWGFGLVVAASIMALLSAAAIGYSRCRHPLPTTVVKSRVLGPGRAFADEEVSFRDCHEVDSSSMMLVPSGHFDAKRTPRMWGRDPPPPYALPPPYPYPSNCDFFFPIANSSVMPRIADVNTLAESSRSNDNADQSLSFATTGAGFATPTETFTSPVSAYNVTNHRPVMRPLFVKTSEGGSEIEITPSAQNSTGLPSPFNRF